MHLSSKPTTETKKSEFRADIDQCRRQLGITEELSMLSKARVMIKNTILDFVLHSKQLLYYFLLLLPLFCFVLISTESNLSTVSALFGD